MLNDLIVGVADPLAVILAISLLGLLAGLAAAVVPAVSAGRQAPMAALSGRFAATTRGRRSGNPALLLVSAGVVFAMTGSVWMLAQLDAAARRGSPQGATYQATATPTGPIALVLLGITAAIIGLVWMLPSLVARWRASPGSCR